MIKTACRRGHAKTGPTPHGCQTCMRYSGRRRRTRLAWSPYKGEAKSESMRWAETAPLRLKRQSRSFGRVHPGLEAKETPTPMLIAWAAGIYEGEGSCNVPSSAGVSQKDLWLLGRMKSLFGGSVTPPSPHHGASSWNISGPRARGFLMTIYPFLSPRRKAQVVRTWA